MRVRGNVLMFGIILSLVSAGCGEPNDPNSLTQSVNVIDNGFSPMTLTVLAGTTVTWSWAGSNQHDVLFKAATGIPSSDLQQVGSFQAQFSTPGTYPYNCSLHLSMVGTIVVK